MGAGDRADLTPLDSLAPEHRAILSLLLVQARSYYEIAELLKIDSARVRQRAHAAVDALAPAAGLSPDAAGRARIADYLVGEQSVSERARTRAELSGSEAERAWAAAVAAALSPLAKVPLPAIPDPDPTPPPEPNPPPEAPTPSRPPEALTPSRPREALTPVPPPEALAPILPPAIVVSRPSAAPDQGSAARRRPRRRLISFLGLLAAAALVVILIAVLAGGGGSPRRTVDTTTGKASPGTTATPVARTIKRLVLSPTGADLKAFGTATIARQPGGGLTLLVQAHGLLANHRNTYAVWLSNGPGDARLLGFVSPSVGPAGTFSSESSLPVGAVRFRELIVTLETNSRPAAPGRAMLQTALALS